jgi:hypothetical protein
MAFEGQFAPPKYPVNGIMPYMTYSGMAWKIEFFDELGEP